MKTTSSQELITHVLVPSLFLSVLFTSGGFDVTASSANAFRFVEVGVLSQVGFFLLSRFGGGWVREYACPVKTEWAYAASIAVLNCVIAGVISVLVMF